MSGMLLVAGGGGGEDRRLRFAGEVDLLGAVAEGGAQGRRRVVVRQTQVRTAAVWIGLLSSTPRSILLRKGALSSRAFGHADGGDQRISRFHVDREFLDEGRGSNQLAHAAVVGDFHGGGRG